MPTPELPAPSETVEPAGPLELAMGFFHPSVRPHLGAARQQSLRRLRPKQLKPFSVKLVQEAAKTGQVITLEDHHRDTGLGRLVATVLADEGLSVKFARMGVAHYASSGAPADLFRDMGLDAAAVCEKASEMLALPSKS